MRVRERRDVTHPVTKTLSAVASPPYAHAMLAVGLLALERVFVVAVALELTSRERAHVLLATLLLAVIFAVRGAISSALRLRVRTLLHRTALDALLDGDVVRSTPLDNQDAQTAVHAGTFAGVALFAEALPGLAGNAVASLFLGANLVHALPARISRLRLPVL